MKAPNCNALIKILLATDERYSYLVKVQTLIVHSDAIFIAARQTD